MTIGAFGNPVAPQFCGFPMIGGKVGFDQLLMARSTTINDSEFCLVQFRVGDIVLRSMTIVTFGKFYFSLIFLNNLGALLILCCFGFYFLNRMGTFLEFSAHFGMAVCTSRLERPH